MTRLCVDCDYHEIKLGMLAGWEWHYCRYDGDILDLVTGETKKRNMGIETQCAEVRNVERYCGYPAKWFKPKES